jgi:gamma-glutamylcyclotransferase (GGCT)/AIG2-like uncharacterized protein YtfP
MTLYVAYGSNLNRQQMRQRCPGARAVMRFTLRDAKLVFRYVLDVEPCKGSTVPCIVWEINRAHEHDLDRYEGVAGGLYVKEYITLDDGSEALIYVMNDPGISPPSREYFQRVKQGYEDFGLDMRKLNRALSHSQKAKAHSVYTERRARGVKLAEPKAKAEPKPEPRRDHARVKAANQRKVMNLTDYLAERRASGKCY